MTGTGAYAVDYSRISQLPLYLQQRVVGLQGHKSWPELHIPRSGFWRCSVRLIWGHSGRHPWGDKLFFCWHWLNTNQERSRGKHLCRYCGRQRERHKLSRKWRWRERGRRIKQREEGNEIGGVYACFSWKRKASDRQNYIRRTSKAANEARREGGKRGEEGKSIRMK